MHVTIIYAQTHAHTKYNSHACDSHIHTKVLALSLGSLILLMFHEKRGRELWLITSYDPMG